MIEWLKSLFTKQKALTIHDAIEKAKEQGLENANLIYLNGMLLTTDIDKNTELIKNDIIELHSKWVDENNIYHIMKVELQVGGRQKWKQD